MNKYQKELIEKCEPYVDGTPFRDLYIIPGGKLYRGFWGINGYNRFYLVCVSRDDKHYVIGVNYQIDSGWFASKEMLNFDIPKHLDCVRFWPGYSGADFVIKDSGVSTIIIEQIEARNE